MYFSIYNDNGYLGVIMGETFEIEEIKEIEKTIFNINGVASLRIKKYECVKENEEYDLYL